MPPKKRVHAADNTLVPSAQKKGKTNATEEKKKKKKLSKKTITEKEETGRDALKEEKKSVHPVASLPVHRQEEHYRGDEEAKPDTRKLFPQGKPLRLSVAFLDGTPNQRDKVKKFVSFWQLLNVRI